MQEILPFFLYSTTYYLYSLYSKGGHAMSERHYKQIKPFSILEALRFGFYTIIEHFAFYIVLMITYVAILSGTLLITLFFVCLPFYQKMSQIFRILDSAGISRWELVKNIVKQLGQPFILTALVGFIIMYVVFRLLNLGMTKIALEFYDHDESSLKSLFQPWRLIVSDTIASLFFIILCLLGYAALVIPGIYIMITFGFYHQLIVDKKLSPLDALRESSRITRGAKWQLVALLFLITFLRWVALSVFGVTLLIFMPLVSLVDVYVYRKLLERAQRLRL